MVFPPDKSVMVIGAGIGGIQASLDLAQAGLFVYLVESSPAIGGRMAQLDKTFPTNDCSMCILSPKLIEVARQPNIKIITLAEIKEVRGDFPSFQVIVEEKPRFIDLSKCTGCGSCARVCPVKVSDEFNEGLSQRKAIYVKYPQAIPLAFSIDMGFCRQCKACVKKCEAKAINLEMEGRISVFTVGSIIIASGANLFDPLLAEEFGYGRYKNVLKSIEFERMLSASGPFGGHLRRLSDEKEPKKIAFLQCIGSRDLERSYCSSVCCMYATKEAVLAREHLPGVECTIFQMDRRSYGKGFDEYCQRAEERYGVKYVYARPSSIKEIPSTKELIIRCVDSRGKVREEIFDLAVLSVGMVASKKIAKLTSQLGLETNEFGFIQSFSLNPVETSRKGVFACGTALGPKDIPDTVIEASAAAAKVVESLGYRTRSLKAVRFSEVKEEPKVGVFVCHCGSNIAGVVKVKEVVEQARSLPSVAWAEALVYACSEDARRLIKERVSEHGLNRVVVAACTPLTHESLFRETLAEAGLNPFLFTMANIRNQCSWVHEGGKATEKAKDLVRMAVARACLLKPLTKQLMPFNHNVLVVGGGLAGLSSALSLANQGFQVYLLEKEDKLGGNLNNFYKTLEGFATRPFLNDLIKKVEGHPHIKAYKEAEVKKVEGFVGNFQTTFLQSGEEKLLKHGVVILATGGEEARSESYFLNKNPKVITQGDLGRAITLSDDNLAKIKTLVMIQCVDREKLGYCSRICCSTAVKNALSLKEKYPEMEIFVLYQDMQTYGFKEKYFNQAREKGVVFIRAYPEDFEVFEEGDGLKVAVEEKVLGKKITLNPDLLVLSMPIVSSKEAKDLARIFKVPLSPEGFFLEAHPKLRPVDFASEGIFLAGVAHYPKHIEETIAQALAASARATTILAQDFLEIGGVVAEVDSDKCVACLTCLRVCPYGAPFVNSQGVAEIAAAKCQGCGSCVGECPAKALSLAHFEDSQILAEVDVSIKKREEPEVIAFTCHYCAYAAADLAGSSRIKYPPNVRAIRIPCSGRIDPLHLLRAFEKGADAVIVAGCLEGTCHYLKGNYQAKRRVKRAKELLAEVGLEAERLELFFMSAAMGERFAEVAKEMVERAERLGPNPLKETELKEVKAGVEK